MRLVILEATEGGFKVQSLPWLQSEFSANLVSKTLSQNLKKGGKKKEQTETIKKCA